MNVDYLPDDFEELINELQLVDGIFGAVVIYDEKLYKLLERKGLAARNVRGGAFGTELLRYMMKVADGNIEVIVNHLKD